MGINQTDLEAFSQSSISNENINQFYLADESKTIQELLKLVHREPDFNREVHDTAAALVSAVRERSKHASGLKAFLTQYDLSSNEGVVLMCLAEALLRIPDSATMDKLISDKLGSGNWRKHLGESDSLFVNASTWALMLTGQVIKPIEDDLKNPAEFLTRLVNRMEEPVIRAALTSAMSIMAHQFVMGRTIEEALVRTRSGNNKDYSYSFDMIGEAVVTGDDADRYQVAYTTAIEAIGKNADPSIPLGKRPGISVKLSALCPRYEYSQKARAIQELSQRLLSLARLAKQVGIGLTVDAEEADRLELSLAIFEYVYLNPSLSDWPGLGIAVQAYQKRSIPVLKWLHKLVTARGRIIPVRLVKGAYWDTEIKHAQEQGLQEYPVFTRKVNTDVSFLASASFLLNDCDGLYPQFATHNAHTLAYIYHAAGNRDYEFQRLHGMGEELYAEVIGRDKLNVSCRVYTPVGSHKDLLPYLMRRLLENGANTSFVNQARHDEANIEDIIAHPVDLVESSGDQIRHPKIPLPSQLFGQQRTNSAGINFADDNELFPLFKEIDTAASRGWKAAPQVAGKTLSGLQVAVRNPADSRCVIGHAEFSDETTVTKAIAAAGAAWPGWNETPAEQRAMALEKAAELYEEHRAELMTLCIREAGKTVKDSHADVREAIDFLRYYALRCREYFTKPIKLSGPTGEDNNLQLHGRGVFLCISPWNFPVAIYTGQIAAALAAGNTVLAKPAEQTSLVANLATQLLYEAGIPESVLNFVPGLGPRIGQTALADPRIAGVAFTGSTETARRINLMLAQRDGPPAAVIAETGGQNAMIVDSSALPEQVVIDVVRSAFNSAGQRCSALRVLYLQEEIAPEVIDLLKGHMEELVIGDPVDLKTDIGPVIDQDAGKVLDRHLQEISKAGKIIHRCKMPAGVDNGNFFPPVVMEIEQIQQLQREVFGPVLHIIRYKSSHLQQIIDDINACGYGLTLGIHSRIMSQAEMIRRRARVGNIYVNRDMIGAVVGVQPFGGRGLSGTGPKAGGPYYLLRFATEQTYTVNTAAIGGNTSLLMGSFD